MTENKNADLTTEAEQSTTETNQEKQSNCQGYKADPITKLHLCTACEYHQYRNETKPWVKKAEEQA